MGRRGYGGGGGRVVGIKMLYKLFVKTGYMKMLLYIMPYHAIPYRTIPHIPYRTVQHRTLPYTIPYHIIPKYILKRPRQEKYKYTIKTNKNINTHLI